MTINNRVAEIRKHFDLTMEAFGARLGVTRSSISRIESGLVGVSSQIATSICREFNVNRTWLETGEGEMFDELSTRELAARIVGQALSTSDEFVINTFIALGQMSPDEWRAIKSFVDKIKGSD